MAKIAKTCPTCGTVFSVFPSQAARRVYCTKACMATGYKTQLAGKANPNWNDALVSVKCAVCGKVSEAFKSIAATKKFCSGKCAGEAKRGEGSPVWKGGRAASMARKRERSGWSPREPRKVRLCLACGEQGLARNAKYHKECRPKPMEPILHECRGCPALVIESRTWCDKCKTSRSKGNRNSNWKGGITPENNRIRASEEYKEWRVAVFKRDDFTCQSCGVRGGNLHAHHKKPFSTHPKLRLDVDNGETLCKPCHEKTDSWLNRAKKIKMAMGR